MNILQQILDHKREETAHRRSMRPFEEVRAAAKDTPAALDFADALRSAPGRPALIAEIKRRSPSRGSLAPGIDPASLAKLYRANGAACISVLTDERFFGGTLDDLIAVKRAAPDVPLLRKDFLCDPYQVYEARAAGADGVLLIAAVLEAGKLGELRALANELGMAALVEVHSPPELAGALGCESNLIGINNRNLDTFEVDLSITEQMCRDLPDGICIVAESGIHRRADVDRLMRAPRSGAIRGIDAILVGEALVTAPDVASRTRELAGIRDRLSPVPESRTSAIPRSVQGENPS